MSLHVAFINVAHQLVADHEGDEGFDRTAVGRAYYAAFHATKAKIIQFNPLLAGVRWQHKQVWRNLMHLGGSSDWSTIGRLGDDLRDLRERADYNNPDDHYGDAAQAVIDAQQILDLLDTITSGPPSGFRPN